MCMTLRVSISSKNHASMFFNIKHKLLTLTLSCISFWVMSIGNIRWTMVFFLEFLWICFSLIVYVFVIAMHFNLVSFIVTSELRKWVNEEIVYPKMCWKFTHAQTIQDVDEFLHLFFIRTDLEKFNIASLAHQWILCSEWVPSEWESKQLIKTSTSNPHDSSPSINILWSEKLRVYKKQIHWGVFNSKQSFLASP